MNCWLELDTSLMMYPFKIHNDGISSEIISNLLIGKFHLNLDGSLCKELLSARKDRGVLKTKSLEDSLKFNIEEIMNCNEDLSKCYEVLSIGISSLQLFVQVNWTGPFEDSKYDPPLQFLRKYLASTNYSEVEWLEKLTADLTLDGEMISPNIKNLELLLVARAVFGASVFQDIVSAKWWHMRCLLIHQQVLEERSPTLYTQLCNLLQELSECETICASTDLATQLHLETAFLWLHYDLVGKANEAIKAAHKLLGLDITLAGALGKRTKFQEREIAQLTLSINVSRDKESSDTLRTVVMPEPTHFPKDVRLEDDVRLSEIKFIDSSFCQFPTLTPAEQAVLLATCIYKQKSQPKDTLQMEQLMPYLTCLTSQPQAWAIQVSALVQRSKIDSEHRRTVERALMQYQTLTDSLIAPQPPVIFRLCWVYSSYLPPAWKVEALLANTYISLGMVQTALDVFLRLQMWEEVIACYNFLKLRHKAAEVIVQELEKKRTVKLLCLLGDATDNIECYKDAWEMSKEQSGRAQRHWAMYYFRRKQYAESIPHLEKSLSINSLQEQLWFRLGYAALAQENWTLCATAYRRYCSLEPESFEAWNNLAKAYVKTGQKARAFRALQEAVKCNYENWRVWDNLMAVSTDCGQFDEVIRCYHRILDLNEKHVDLEVLKILTTVVVKDLNQSKECTTAKLRKQSLALFGRLTSQVLNNSTLWQLYAQLASSDESTPENRVKVAQCLQKAYRAATQGSWERDTNTCQQVIMLCVDLAKAFIQCSSQCSTSNESVQMLSSAKLPLKSVLSKIEKDQTDMITGELPEVLSSGHKDLLSLYELIIDNIQKLQAT